MILSAQKEMIKSLITPLREINKWKFWYQNKKDILYIKMFCQEL